jgi:hypothetical protein
MDFVVVRTEINKKKIVIFFVMLGPYVEKNITIYDSPTAAHFSTKRKVEPKDWVIYV